MELVKRAVLPFDQNDDGVVVQLVIRLRFAEAFWSQAAPVQAASRRGALASTKTSLQPQDGFLHLVFVETCEAYSNAAPASRLISEAAAGEKSQTDSIGIRLEHVQIFLAAKTQPEGQTAVGNVPFYFESVLHRGSMQTGLLMTAWPIGVSAVSMIAGRLSDRCPAPLLGCAGMLLEAAGMALLAILPANASSTTIVWRLALCGLGYGLFQAPNNRMLLSAAPRDRTGAASGVLAAARLIGLSFGSTAAAIIFRLAPGRQESTALLLTSTLAVVSAFASVTRLSRRKRRIDAESKRLQKFQQGLLVVRRQRRSIDMATIAVAGVSRVSAGRRKREARRCLRSGKVNHENRLNAGFFSDLLEVQELAASVLSHLVRMKEG